MNSLDQIPKKMSDVKVSVTSLVTRLIINSFSLKPPVLFFIIIIIIIIIYFFWVVIVFHFS